MTRLNAIACLLLSSSVARASETGNPPIFYSGSAGPYALRVSIHPPDVIPGLAKLQIETDEAGPETLRVVALPLAGAQAALPPTPDQTERSPTDPRLRTGQLWLMSSGSWQVRILADGARGPGELSIPVPALPTHVAHMPPDLGALLLGFLLILGCGLVSIAAAAVREGQLDPGEQPSSGQRRRGNIAAGVAGAIVLLLVLFGDGWWMASARAYAQSVYKPLSLSAETEGNGQLQLTLEDPGWLPSRKLDDLVGADGHPLDLWMLALPDLDRVWHLHPAQAGPDQSGRFVQALPAMPAGRYVLFASLVHENGLEEIARGEVSVPETAGHSLGPADARGLSGPLGSAEGEVAALSNGGRLLLEPDGTRRAGQPSALRFRVMNRQGEPERYLEPVGRLAAAIIVSADHESFVRLSTRGTVSQAAWSIANPGVQEAVEVSSSELTFSAEFPRPGQYRVFVELRVAGQNEIAILDLRVL